MIKTIFRLNVIVVLLLILFLNTPTAHGQYTHITLQCKENFDQCDTVTVEKFNEKGQILYRLKFGEHKTSIDYIYNEKKILVKKVHRNELNEITKNNHIYSDSTGFWHTDSLIDYKGKLLYTFKRTPTGKTNNYMIEWFYKNDPNPSSRQIIQYDENGKELSNSTCYSADNCVTYVYFYNQGHKIRTELWAMEGPNSQPILKETEEFIYSTESEHHATSSVRFLEPEHTLIGRYKYVILDTFMQKK